MNLFNSKLISRLTLTLSCVLSVTAVVHPARSAERIGVSYSFLSGSTSISSLQTYARTGQIDSKLADSGRTSSKQLTQLQQLLYTKIPLDSVAVSQFLQTPIGEKLLGRLEQVIQTDGHESKSHALRDAIILAARNPQGFTALEVLQHFPSKTAYIKIEEALALVGEVNQFVNQTHDASMVVNQKATLEAQFPSDLSKSENLQQPGKLAWQKQTLTLSDPERARQIITDLYVPRSRTRHPIVVISHGLGSDRFSFAYLAEHLASYGFAVVVPEHSGSNSNQLAALLAGRTRDIIPPQEFVDRPIDVSKLLNKLEQLSHIDPNLQGRLDLQNVGIVGQSFGGNTALILAGATLQVQNLKARCQTSQDSLNPSLLLQCEATRLPQLPSHLSDPRIKAAIAINPFSSAIFGQAGLSQIKVPTMIVASSADMLAPAIPEQIQPFTWLTTPNKYLALMTGATHFSALAPSPNEVVPVLPFLVGTNPALVHQYIKALNVAFFKTYLMNQQQYHSYVSAGYAKAISQLPVQLALVKTLNASDLSKNLEDRLSLSLRAFCFCLYSLLSQGKSISIRLDTRNQKNLMYG
ncbi:alpha/beta hydrolase [Scytonema sp. PCC 10023]|uniref:alpha/beta hydrolase n=1 Tax=Scytonema sp. PCC 10023 TaxID=1680591 RepID=UPI0039C6B315